MAKQMKTLIEMDKDLWFKFRGSAFNQGKTVKDLLAEVIRNHLGLPDETPKDETSENEPEKADETPENETPENEPSEPRRSRPSRSDFDRDNGGNKR